MEYHTVYNSYEQNGRDYLGKHSTENPYDDYLGSFSDKTFQPEQKIILAYATSAEGAVWLEVMFQKVFGVVENDQFVNKSYQTSEKFHYDWTGKIRSPENRENAARALRGKTKSEEHKRNMRKPKCENHGRNVSLSRQGMKLSPQHCENISKGNTGKKRTAEFCKNHSEIMIGLNTWSKGRSWYHNELGETQMCYETPGPDWKPGRKPKQTAF